MRASLCLAAALAAASCAPPQMMSYTVKVNEHYGHLTNGTHVILLPDRTAPLVQVDVRYDVGSKDDPPGREGLAHLVEHLLYLQHQAGPEQPSLGAVLRQHAVGFNASTTWDFTHYETTARDTELPAVIALEALRLGTGCATLTAELLDREREVVKNELRLRFEGPAAQLYLGLIAQIYPDGHAYHRGTGGSEASLSAITLADVCAFVTDHYTPGRATVVVAGNIDEHGIQKLVADTFGGVPARAGAAPVAVAPIQLGKRRATVDFEGDADEVAVVWPLPPEHGRDGYTLPLVSEVVVGSTRGRTYSWSWDRVETEASIVGGPRAPALAVFAKVAKGHSAAATADEILAGADHAWVGLGDEGMVYVRAAMMGELAFGLESLAGRTMSYADYAQFESDTGGFGVQVKRIEALDRDQLEHVVKRVLDPDKAMVIHLRAHKGAVAGGDRPRLATVTERRADDLPIDGPQAAAPIDVPTRSTLAGRVRRFELANGLRVVLSRTDAPIPVVTATLLFGEGSGHEPPGKRGLAYLVGDLTAGRFFGLGVLPTVRVRPDSTAFTARAVVLFSEQVLAELATVTGEHQFRGSLGDALKKSFAEELKKPRTRARVASSKPLGEAVFGAGHPYASAYDPAVMAHLDVDEDDVNAFVKQHYGAANATLIVAGVFDEEAVEKVIRKKFGGWPRGSADAPVTTAAAAPAGPTIIGVAGPDSALLEVRGGFATPGGLDRDHAARLVLVEMLDRRLLRALREQLGAAYVMNALHLPSVGPSIIELRGAVDAARGGEALAALQATLDGLRRGDDFLDDFVRARAAVLARLVASANDSLTVADGLAQASRFGLPEGYDDELAGKVARLSPRDVLALARRDLDAAHEVLVCAGKRAAVEAAFAGAKLTATKIVE